ncbi:MAG: PrsW family intramembrane metalloprotease [Phormidesmis sp. CAN_BIN36]|nr:PrsW family intramembrane metalloprotease [Phormidesmis sp. CAN_BIN36]
MTGEPLTIASLRQLPSGTFSEQRQPTYPLSTEQIIAIGRDPRCQVVLDPTLHSSVSRRHVEIRPTATTEDGRPVWWVCDLNSSNGTYLNGKRLRGCRVLKAGDRVSLGQTGPTFAFDYCLATSPPPPAASQTVKRIKPVPLLPQAPRNVTFTQLFPIASAGLGLRQKAYLAPGIITVGFVVGLFVAVGNAVLFNLLLATYIALAAYYFVYQLCGKHKPWWVLLIAGLSTVVLLQSPVLPLFIVLFRQVLPGQVPETGEPMNFVVLLIRMFFGAGLMEELLKALPLLGFYLLGRLLPTPWKERIGISEPLDGILLGTASAVGFTLLETLGQYVPDMIQNTTLQLGDGPRQLMGLQLLIPRLLGSISGHMAYSGYLGYFIGLSVLNPRQSVVILGTGYLSAASLHALWNAIGSVSPFVLALVGILSYAFLGAAILKARALSPTRSQNFATHIRR